MAAPIVHCPNCQTRATARRAPSAWAVIGWCLPPLLIALAALWAISAIPVPSHALLLVPPLALLLGLPAGIWGAIATAPHTCRACHYPYVVEVGDAAQPGVKAPA